MSVKTPLHFDIANRGPALQAPAVPTDYMRARYFDTDTGEILPFSHIVGRIQRTEKQMRRLNAEMMFDLFFLWSNWKTGYQRGDSFRAWVKENLDVSYSYTWDIIKVVDLVVDNEADASYDFLQDKLSKLLDDQGIQRLKLVAQIENPERRDETYQALIGGQAMSVDEILAVNKPKTTIVPAVACMATASQPHRPIVQLIEKPKSDPETPKALSRVPVDPEILRRKYKNLVGTFNSFNPLWAYALDAEDGKVSSMRQVIVRNLDRFKENTNQLIRQMEDLLAQMDQADSREWIIPTEEGEK